MTWNPGLPEADLAAADRILGIDPGSRDTGWGFVCGPAARPSLVECGVIRLRAAGEDLPRRLVALQREVDRLLARLEPTAAAVESPFHGANARSALQLAHARGVILASLAAAAIPIAEYTPATVKKALTGNGGAPKDQVREMVRRLLRGRDPGASRDASDALAVALCHVTAGRFLAAVTRAVAARPPGGRGGR